MVAPTGQFVIFRLDDLDESGLELVGSVTERERAAELAIALIGNGEATGAIVVLDDDGENGTRTDTFLLGEDGDIVRRKEVS